MKKTVETIETERLILRGIADDDANEIVSWRSDPSVYQYFKHPHEITIEEHLNWYSHNYQFNLNRYDWMCIEKQTSQKIGLFGLIRGEMTAEVNYLLAPEAQHNGYAAEGIIRLIQFAADVWNIHVIIAEIHKDNIPSIAVVKKIGFQLQSNTGDFVVYQIEA